MRKNSIFAALAAFVVCSCSTEPQPALDLEKIETNGVQVICATNPESSLVSGSMKIRITEDFAERAEALTDDEGNVDVSKLTSSGVSLENFGIVSMKRLFPYAGKFEARTRAEGLHRWYVIGYDETKSLTKATTDICSIPGIDVLELVPKEELVGDPHVTGYVDASAASATSSSLPFNDPRLADQWHYYNDGHLNGAESGCDINVVPVWKTYTTGDPDVIVGVVDVGVDYNHEDLVDNIWVNPEKSGDTAHGFNFTNNTYNVVPGNHGTHVSGTIAAINNNGIGVCGIAGGDAKKGQKGVKIMSCQILDSSTGEGSGGGDTAIKWSADHGAVISQNSWGMTGAKETPLSLKAAVDYFNKYAGFDENGKQVGPMAGGVVIFAAGNENCNYSSSTYEGIISVASVGADYRRAYYSCYGDWVTITAPGGDAQKGFNVLSTLTNNKYGTMQGTSMACPHVSGVAALLISYFGGQGFTNTALRKMLVENVTDISAFNRNYAMGSGLVNAYRSIASGGGVAPNRVTDLTVSASSNNVTFSCSVPSDEDDGTPNSILIYYGTSSFSSTDGQMFTNAYVGDAKAGSTITGTISGLEFNTKYYFGAVACDLAGNKSKLSQLVSARTGSNDAPVITPTGETSFTLKPHETAIAPFTAVDPNGHYIYLELKKGSAAEVLDTLDRNAPKINITAKNAPAGSYTSTLVVKDYYGASTSATVNYTILENHKPQIVAQMPDIVMLKSDETKTLTESSYFKDEDGEQLSYKITNTDENVANVNYSKGGFYITPMGLGYATVTVVASDVLDAQASQSFRILVRESNDAVEVYPNPVKTNLYVRTGEEGSADITLVNGSGATVYEKSMTVSAFDPATIDMKSMAAGVYTMIIKYNGQTYNRTVVKI